MPTTSGQLMLQDYDAALQVRGFEMFSPDERKQLINLGYRYVARQLPFTWEQTSRTYTIHPGDGPIDIGSGIPTNIDSVRLIYVTDSSSRRKLVVETYQRFTEKWLSQDLTDSRVWAQCDRYHVFGGKIYLLPPPSVVTTVEVHYYQVLFDLIEDSDTGAMPQLFDEVILDAALVRCHQRVHELQLASEAQLRVEATLEDLLQDDIFQMEELQERVRPDDSWL